MNSRLFSTFDFLNPDNEGFIRDIKKASSISGEELSILLPFFIELKKAKTKLDEEELFNELEQKVVLPLSLINDVFSLANFLLKIIKDDEKILNDSISDWNNDLVDNNIIEIQNSKNLEVFFSFLRENIYPKFKETVNKAHYENGVLPAIQSIGTTIEVRAVLEKELELGGDIDEYNPNIIDTVPIVSIKIGLDSGIINEICFQATLKDLDYIIGELQGAKKGLNLFIKKLQMK
jgi:hypothetical protein